MQEIINLVNLELKGENINKDKALADLKIVTENKIGIVQVDSIVGDVKENYKKAKAYIEWANKLNLEAIVFPELFLIGYPIYDLLKRFPYFADENIFYLNELAKISNKTKVIIGFVEKNQFNKNKFFNSVAILSNGKIEKIIRKNIFIDDEFGGVKNFEQDKLNLEERIIEICGKKALIIIGEKKYENDIIDNSSYDEFFTSNVDFDFVINIVASSTRNKKEQFLNKLLSGVSKKYLKPIIYVNKVGAIDNVSFMGSSVCYDSFGEVVARLNAFSEDFSFIDLSFDKNKNKISNSPIDFNYDNEKFSLDYEYDLERTYLLIVNSIKNYFEKNGFKKAVLGISGGLDSTICAVLLADAIGKENVYGISMPSKITSIESKNDGKILCENLGINFLEMPILDMVYASDETFKKVFGEVEKKWDNRYKNSLTMDNIQARSRAMILWGISNEFGSTIPIATSDKSELYMGYATINGDMSGGFAPIGDVTKTKLFALGHWMNKNRDKKDVIPISILNKRPGAELAINPKTGKPLLAEEALMPYEFLDEIIYWVENYNKNKDELLRHNFIYEDTNSVTYEQKKEWIEKFYSRINSAKFKWGLMAPSPLVDTYSINKSEFSLPITSKIKF